MYFRVVVVCALGLLAASPSLAEGDDACADWTNNVEDLLFSVAREEITKAGKDFQSIPDLEKSLGWHTGISMKGISVGNLTSFALTSYAIPACLMCQTSNDTVSNNTIAMEIGFSNIGISIENFELQIPLLPNIGNTKTKIRNEGNAFRVSVSVLTTPQSNCTVELNYFQIRDMGAINVEFQNGFFNRIYQSLINSRFTTWGLKRFGGMDRLEEMVSSTVHSQAASHGADVCDLIHNILG